ncbi:integrase, catalytic region domain protein [Burkholderia gladioli]|uniref:Integrase, catalytic region domain protein n=1 Tax=Burkholderia gladioli TaxID=28095 RepID=A0AAW3FC12_BURGA|nr:integrase, catalytic region domain protein [Burkholderia gladioli]
MRPDAIVVTPPLLNDDLGFDPCPKPLQAQTFIPELAVEAFIAAVSVASSTQFLGFGVRRLLSNRALTPPSATAFR